MFKLKTLVCVSKYTKNNNTINIFIVKMASISHQQAQAIADGFLDSLGEDKEAFQPQETYTQLVLLAGALVAEAAENLERSNSTHSGKLSTSITAEEPEESGGRLSIEVTMLGYGQFINKGVKGTQGGSGEFSFKNDRPSKKMVEALREYIRGGTMRVASIKRKTVSRAEVKNVSLSDMDSAYALARSIKQHGIKPTGFMDKAIQTIESRMAADITEGLTVDIINAMPDNL